MRTTILLLVLAAVAAAQEIPEHPDRLKYRELKFEVPDATAMRSTLAGGTPIYALEDASLPIVELRVFVKAGSFWEPKGKEGLSSLCGSLMRTGGTASRDPNALDEELDFLAADLSVSLGETYGTASLSVLSKDLDKGLEILVDVLRNPAFRQEKLDILKAQTLEQLKARNDSTGAIERRETDLLLYGDFPVNRLATGASVASITREDLSEFHRRCFHPGNFILAAAGSFHRVDFAKKLEETFRDWPKGGVRPESIPSLSHKPKPSVYTLHKEGANINQGRVTIAHHGFDIHHPDVHPMRVMSYIFGAGGFSSRLVQKVRTEEGLAYDVRSDFRPGFEYPSLFRIAFQSKSESCAYAAKLCLQELERFRKEGPTEQELKDAIQFYLDAFPGLFFSTPIQTVTTYAQAELQGYPKDYYATYREKIAQCTVEDLKRVANDHLHPDRFVFVVIGNIDAISKGDGKHEAKLEEFGPVVAVPLPDPITLERPTPEPKQ